MSRHPRQPVRGSRAALAQALPLLLLLLLSLALPQRAAAAEGVAGIGAALTGKPIDAKVDAQVAPAVPSAASSAAASADCAIRNSPYVMLRAEAKLDSAMVAVLQPEDRLAVVERAGDWVRVASSKGTGWMRAWYLAEPPGGAKPAPVAPDSRTDSSVPPLPAMPPVAFTPPAATGGFTPPPPRIPEPVATNPATPSPAVPASPAAPSGRIRGSRILLVGDSHSVGIYGTELDKSLRQAGATVRSVGVSGSSPAWWWSGTVTKSGFVDRRADGSKDQPADWRTPRATPSFAGLLADHRPDVVVISLGANMVGASAKKIAADCGRLVDLARGANARVVWVGPPDARDAARNGARDRFYASLQEALGGRAEIFDARRCTRYPASGGDGVHYWGAEGTRQAKAWANAVFEAIGK